MIIRGMGADATNQPPVTPLDQLWGALSTTLPMGETGLPVWVIAIAAVFGAWLLVPATKDFWRR